MSNKPARDLADKQHSQLFLNDDFLGEGDFIGENSKYREFTLTVKQVTLDELQLPGRSTKEDKVVLTFEKAKKRLVLNKTNGAAIKSHYGKQVRDWYGKPLTIYYDPTVMFGRDRVGGVRIRPKT